MIGMIIDIILIVWVPAILLGIGLVRLMKGFKRELVGKSGAIDFIAGGVWLVLAVQFMKRY